MAKQLREAKKNGLNGINGSGHKNGQYGKNGKVGHKRAMNGFKPLKVKANGKKVNGVGAVKQPKFTQAEIDKFQNSVKQMRDERFEKVRNLAMKDIKANNITDSFMVFDIENVRQRIQIWRKFLPRVELWYAAKVLEDDKVYKAIIDEGCGFDVASVHEFEKVLKLGVDPKLLIFANPVKEEFMIAEARKQNVKRMTFDSVEELHKIAKIFPEAECVVRIAVKETSALYNLSEKFGASMKDIPDILQTSKELSLPIVGVAFHTGSGGVTIPSYESSIYNARKIFDMAKSMGLREMDFLDIGGGFTIIHDDNTKNFPYVAPKIGQLIDKVFPDPSVRVIAEPGRFVAESLCYLLTRIIGQKTMDNGNKHYYCNNGIYQSYLVRQFGEDMFQEPLDKTLFKTRKMLTTTMWGQTCDSCDWVYKNQQIPEMKTGEWMITRDHGAYHKDLATHFNGFKLPENKYIYKL